MATLVLFVVPLPLVLLSPTAYAWTPSGLVDALAQQQPAAAELLPAPPCCCSRWERGPVQPSGSIAATCLSGP